MTSSALRVLYITNLYPPDVIGGAEIACSHLVHWMRTAGHEVAVFTSRSQSKDPTEDHQVFRHASKFVGPPGKATITCSRLLRTVYDHCNLEAARDLSLTIREFAPNVIHFHCLKGLGFNLLNVSPEIPAVVTAHDFGLLCLKASMFKNGCRCDRLCFPCRTSHLLKRRYLSSRRRVLLHFPSDWLANFFADYLSEERAVIPNLLILPRHTSRDRAGDDSRCNIIYAGSIAQHKGIEFVLGVIDDSPDLGDRIRLTVVGDGPLLSKLRNAYTNRPWVSFTGPLSFIETDRRIHGADLLIVPSLWREIYGLNCHEALWHGTPMLVCDDGGPPDFVRQGVNGLRVEVGSQAAWRVALQSAIVEKQFVRWRETAEIRRKQMAETVSADVIGGRYTDLYHRLRSGR